MSMAIQGRHNALAIYLYPGFLCSPAHDELAVLGCRVVGVRGQGVELQRDVGVRHLLCGRRPSLTTRALTAIADTVRVWLRSEVQVVMGAGFDGG